VPLLEKQKGGFDDIGSSGHDLDIILGVMADFCISFIVYSHSTVGQTPEPKWRWVFLAVTVLYANSRRCLSHRARSQADATPSAGPSDTAGSFYHRGRIRRA
jgi:hypothetical protein